MSGVRNGAPARRSRAARTSSIVIGSMRRDDWSTKLNTDSGLRVKGLSVHVRRRGEIFNCQAERFEERDLVCVAARGGAADEHLADLADNVRRLNHTFLQRDENIAGLFEGRL